MSRVVEKAAVISAFPRIQKDSERRYLLTAADTETRQLMPEQQRKIREEMEERKKREGGEGKTKR
ncbi:hypothetical protein EYF80_017187 [Liparis tanakae]|uniref:Uncharacterized protein n=1 Tax=Liparis tanakae TaxID=230148 RepID=A0A4Z2I432_9TELE|nr:hypothetical protein EYF80_017187 [Liparis tanakae]